MNCLLIGSGGREHAFAAGLAASEQIHDLFIAPGNAGTAQLGKNVSLDLADPVAVYRFVQEEKIGLVVIGPEQPLVDGLADFLESKKVPVVGPKKEGATLEGSKEFSKQFMRKYGIPTAKYGSFYENELDSALKYLDNHPLPIVVKASGLAAGKGVLICESREEAEAAVRQMLSGAAFGESGKTVVIEEFLEGIEVSVFVLTDGKSWKLLPEAKDYKRIGEGDTGLNTGGMGAVSPVPFADKAFMDKVKSRIIEPTLDGLQADEIDYKGFVFIGLMNVGGDPYVIEYNVRMGDPETEVVFPRIQTDLGKLMIATARGKLSGLRLETDPRTAATVMLVSGGYPESYEKGKRITGLDQVNGSEVFHAGTKQSGNEVLTNGGRVLALTSLGETLEEALAASYHNAEVVNFEGKYYRKDIGKDLLG